MKKLLLVALLPVVFTANAQNNRYSSNTAGGSHFSIGLEAGLPVGENGKPYSMALGGSLQYEAMPATDVGITVNAGYTNYSLKSDYGTGNVGFIPVMAGVKYYFTPGAYFHAQLGAAFGTKSDQGTNFAYGPGVGIRLSPNIDAELKYNGVSNKAGSIDNVGVRLAYNF